LIARHFASAARALFNADVMVFTCSAVGCASAACRLFITPASPVAAVVSSAATDSFAACASCAACCVSRAAM